jgi:hypothetical protein
LSTDQQTVGNWFHWWLENVAGEDLEPNSYEQYRTILKSVNEKSAFTKLFLTDASSAGLYFFYRRELKKQLSSAWSKRIYRFARYALAAAARAGVAPNYPQGSDLFMIGHRFARALKVGFTTVSVLLVLLLIFAGVRVVRYNEDWLTAGATVARENGLGVVVAAVEDVYYGHIKVAAVGGTPTGGADFGGAPVDSASPSESPSETQSAVPSPTPSATSKPTHRPNPRPTPSESPSATPTETPSPSPSETPTETPTPTLVSFVAEWGPALSPSSVPRALKSPVKPVKDEGVWQRTRILVNGVTAIRVARVRPDAVHTSYFATVTWLDPRLLAFTQVPGTEIPEGKFEHGNGKVPAKLKPYYVAGLNDGFLMRDSQGGYILDGKVIKHMVKGKATLVTYTDGTIDVVQWGRDHVRGNIQAARQNLQLTVDGGASQVLDESQNKWGWVWRGIGSGKNLVWRSGLGIRADGTVVFVIGDALSAKSLSSLLVRAGAVRAMPLDMNNAYANGFLYGPYKGGKRLDPNIIRGPDRFWIPSERDFVAVFMKSPAKANG